MGKKIVEWKAKNKSTAQAVKVTGIKPQKKVDK